MIDLADAIMITLLPIFAAIRQTRGVLPGGIGFLHPITDKVTISAHGCESHSWSRKIVELQDRKASVPDLNRLAGSPKFERKVSAPSRVGFGFSTLPRV